MTSPHDNHDHDHDNDHLHDATTRVGALLPMPSCLGIGSTPVGPSKDTRGTMAPEQGRGRGWPDTNATNGFSLSRFHFLSLSACSLSCSSTSMSSETPRIKTTSLTHNEEYYPWRYTTLSQLPVVASVPLHLMPNDAYHRQFRRLNSTVTETGRDILQTLATSGEALNFVACPSQLGGAPCYFAHPIQTSLFR